MPTNQYTNIATATTTVVKASPGVLVRIIINLHIASNAITLYDNTAGSGTKIGTITPATIVSNPPIAVQYDLSFATGLTIVTAGSSRSTRLVSSALPWPTIMDGRSRAKGALPDPSVNGSRTAPS